MGSGGGHWSAEGARRAALVGHRGPPADHQPPRRSREGAGSQAGSRGDFYGPRAEGETRRRDGQPAVQGARRARLDYGEAPLRARRGLRGARLGRPRERQGATEDQLPLG